MSIFASAGPLKRRVISINASGNNLLSISVAGKRIRLIALFLTPASAVAVTLRSGTTTSLTGAIPISGSVPLAWFPFDGGYVETATGEDLNIFTSLGVQIDGLAIYQEVN